MVASYPEKRFFVGNLIKIDNNNNTIIPENLQTKITNLESERKTIVAVFIEYKLACHDIGLDCGYIIEDKTEEDIVKSAEQHIWEIHAIKPEEITSEMRARITQNIRNS